MLNKGGSKGEFSEDFLNVVMKQLEKNHNEVKCADRT